VGCLRTTYEIALYLFPNSCVHEEPHEVADYEERNVPAANMSEKEHKAAGTVKPVDTSRLTMRGNPVWAAVGLRGAAAATVHTSHTRRH
jgi:hypothetical protein